MTLVWIEGFDHLDEADFHKKDWQGDTPKRLTRPGRVVGWGVNSRALQLEFPRQRVFKSFTGSPGVWIFGVAFKPDSMGTGLSENFVDFFNFSGTCGGLALQETAGDVVLVITDESGIVVGTGTTIVAAGDWHYYEIKIDFSDPGTAEAHLDGIAEIGSSAGSFANLDGGPIWVALNASGSARWWFDDMYVLNTVSPPNDDWLGDNCIETLYPVEDGFHHDWTPDTGTKHYVRVNEGQADGDTSFVHTDTAGDKDTYGLSNLGISRGPVLGAQLNVEVRKNDASTRQIAPLIRQSSTDYDGPTYTLTDKYLVYSWTLDQDPSGADWTIDQINADEYGVEVIT